MPCVPELNTWKGYVINTSGWPWQVVLNCGEHVAFAKRKSLLELRAFQEQIDHLQRLIEDGGEKNIALLHNGLCNCCCTRKVCSRALFSLITCPYVVLAVCMHFANCSACPSHRAQFIETCNASTINHRNVPEWTMLLPHELLPRTRDRR